MPAFNNYDASSFDGVRSSWQFRGDKLKKLSRKRGGSIVDLLNKADVTTTPTLVMSIGGLGGETLNEVKKQLKKRVKPQVAGNERVLLAALDTCQVDIDSKKENLDNDNNNEIGFLEDTEQIQIIENTTPQKVEFVKTALDQDVPQHQWIDRGLPRTIHIDRTGAGATRQVGRLGLSIGDNYNHVKNEIKNKLKVLSASGSLTALGAVTINVILVAGISGGTGSGNIIDTAYMLYLAAKELGGICLRVEAILYTPDVQKNEPGINYYNLQRNFIAAMKEIDNYFKAEDTGEEYTFKSDLFPDGKLHDNGVRIGDGMSIFQGITLVQGYNAAGAALDKKIPVETVANYIVHQLCDVKFQDIATGSFIPLFDALLSNELVADTGFHENNLKLPKDNYYYYRAIGYHDVEFPIEEIMTVVANHVLVALHQQYQKEPEDNPVAVVTRAGIYPFCPKCFEKGDNQQNMSRFVAQVNSPNNYQDVKKFRIDQLGTGFSHFDSYPYDEDRNAQGWIKSAYNSIVQSIQDEFMHNGPYAALRLSQGVCAVFDMALEETNKETAKKNLEKNKNDSKQEMQRIQKEMQENFLIDVANWFSKEQIQKKVTDFNGHLANYGAAIWEIHWFDKCMQAVSRLREMLVEQHNKVFNQYVGAFLSICDVLQADSTAIVNATYTDRRFRANLLNPKDLSNTDSRLFEVIKYFINPQDISNLSQKFIESMLENETAWVADTNSRFDAIAKFKDLFSTYFTKFKQNIVQRFMIIKYTAEDLVHHNIPIAQLFSTLDSYINDTNNHPDPWQDFEDDCQTNYNIQPLHRAAQEILREALSIQYCAVGDDNVVRNGNTDFSHFPQYNLLCLMQDTPDINKIILGDPQANIDPLPAYAQWLAGGNTRTATANIPSVFCMRVVYKLPLFMYKGFSECQKVYYKAVTSGSSNNAGMHMDASQDNPWIDFPQVLNMDALRLIEGSTAMASLRDDYRYEKEMMVKIKEQADYCQEPFNGMIAKQQPEDHFYCLYYPDRAFQENWDDCHTTLIAAFKEDIRAAANLITSINLDDPENDWNRQFNNNFAQVPLSLKDRMTAAQYQISVRKLHEIKCMLDSSEENMSDYEDEQDAGQGGFYKVIRRSTKSRLLLKDVFAICHELNDELETIKNDLIEPIRSESIKKAKQEKAAQELENETKDHANKVRLFFIALIYGFMTIEHDEDNSKICLNIGQQLCDGQEFLPFDYLGGPDMESENLLYAVFTQFFLFHRKDDAAYWKQFELDLNNANRPDKRSLLNHYNNFKALMSDMTRYYPNNTLAASRSVSGLNQEWQSATNCKFPHFADTKLTLDGLNQYANPAAPFGFSIGSQLIRFYYEIKKLIKNYRLDDEERA